MDGQTTLGLLLILVTLPRIVMSATSISCNTTQICLGGNTRNTSGGIDNVMECCRNRSTTSDTNLLQNSGNLNETTVVPTSVVYIFAKNGSRECLNDSICNSDEICLSVECLTTRSTTQSRQCQCRRCKDGRCFNRNDIKGGITLPPTTLPPPGITTLQLVLLFGSMGGIVVVICIVYCVKSFTDNRQRQYLLKHGVWDTPREDRNKDDDIENDSNKSGASREDSKMDVPTIRVQLENEISKSKESKIETLNEQEDDEEIDEVTEAVAKPKIEPHIVQPDIIQVKGYVPIPHAPTESPYHQNANLNRPTKDPHIEKTIPQATIGTPTEQCNSPVSWNKGLSSAPLTDIPLKKRGIPNLNKTKDPPKKIIANGTPEKSPKFNNKTRTASPPKLVEPENFSDFGM